ncbi:acetyl xylan esterase [Archangium violaceum]|uniref:SGNH/GDSL hydrolase family protein n=1 Tax=Archangium violaceum TaxID=83451 RepID=UPI00193BAB82|nr:SGNH/GDSL hydrolase family protein [Archangium violaceum]QRK10951.1 acetyl xylan esterase [Archangium violaceum]
MIRPRLPWLLPILAMAGCAPFEPWFDYNSNDEKIQHIGRIDWKTPDGPTYAYPGVTHRFRCNCTGVDVAFKDLGGGGESNTNWVNIIVDGETKAKVELKQDAELLRGVRGLKKGEHTIEIVKRTGPHAGSVRFLGVSLQGVLVDPPGWRPKKLEVIGDSITCGYGNEERIPPGPDYTGPNTGYHAKNEDVSQAYGTLLGRRFDAEVVTTCLLGAGIYRNVDGATEGKAFPYVYERIYPNREDSEAPRFDTTLFSPDLIVINLGNNDFNVLDESGTPSAPPKEAFQTAYENFVRKLRELYPAAKIVCTIGPTMNDTYPEGRNHWTLAREYISEMVKSLGDPNVLYFAYDTASIPSDTYGEDWHPTAEGHAAMADQLSTFIEQHGGL